MRGLIVAFHTNDALYRGEAARMKVSAARLGLALDVTEVETSSWIKIVRSKVQFLATKRRELRGPLLYVDVDAVFHSDPWPLLTKIRADVSFAVLGDNKARSGTVYLSDTDGTAKFLEDWQCRLKGDPEAWDQHPLNDIVSELAAGDKLGYSWSNLPLELCYIFDFGDESGERSVAPVIEHLQASREITSRGKPRHSRRQIRLGEIDSILSDDFQRVASENDRLSQLNVRLTERIARLSVQMELAGREAALHHEQSLELLATAREERRVVEAKLAASQRLNSALLVVRGRYEATCEELARMSSARRAIQNRLESGEKSFEKERKVSDERLRGLTQRLKRAEELAQSRHNTIIALREDRSKKIEQRNKLQAAAVAIREDRALQVQRREERIREREEQNRVLDRSVKRLEKRIQVLRERALDLEQQLEQQRQQAREAEAARDAAFRPAEPPSRLAALSERVVPGLKQKRIRASIELVAASGLFDADFYRERYTDLVGDEAQLLDHYVRHGGVEGRSPSAAFNGARYLQRYPDVAAAGLNPLVHFLATGRAEGRVADALATSKKSGASGGAAETATVAEPVGEQVEVADLPEAAISNAVSDVAPAEAAETETDRGETATVTEKAETNSPHRPEAGTPDEAPADDRADELDAGHAPGQLPKLGAPATQLAGQDEQDEQDTDSFSALAVGASDWATAPELADEDAVKTGGIAVAIANPSASDDALAALRWFEALDSANAPAAACEPSAAVRAALHGEALIIDDAWLSGDFRLQLRVSLATAEPLVLRACQRDGQGAIALCAEQSLSTGQSHLVEIALASRFDPLLLVISDRCGALIDSTLLPFPTLLRGGLHHGELIDSARTGAGWAAHRDYAAQLLAAGATGARPAIRDVTVALAAANGTEAIFSKSFRQSLARRFGVAIKPELASTENPAQLVLADQLRSSGAAGDARTRSSGRTLSIDANSIPSLNILLAKEADLAEASVVRTIIVDELNRRPLRAIDHPLNEGGSGSLVQQFFVPPLVPGHSQDRPAPIISIRFAGKPVSDVRAAIPVATDPFAAAPALAPVPAGPVSAIIDCNGDPEALRALLASLSSQSGTTAIECLLVGQVPEVEDSTQLRFDREQRLSLVRTRIEGGSTRGRLHAALELATHDCLLLVDDRKTLHDPRTLGVLRALCGREDVGTAGCHMVRENLSKKGVVSYEAGGGFVPTRRSGTMTVARLDSGTLVHWPFYPLLANPLGCLMIKREDWPSDAGEWSGAESADEGAIALGRAIVERGKLNVATTLVAVTDNDDVKAAMIETPWAAADRFIAMEEY